MASDSESKKLSQYFSTQNLCVKPLDIFDASHRSHGRTFLEKICTKASKRQKIKRESYEADSFLFAEAVVTYGECGIKAELTEDFRLRFAVLKSKIPCLKLKTALVCHA